VGVVVQAYQEKQQRVEQEKRARRAAKLEQQIKGREVGCLGVLLLRRPQTCKRAAVQ
jgi:hypothetical protein